MSQDFNQQRGYRPLFLWVIWAAAALAVYLSFYQDTDVWDFVEHDTSRITWIIMALFALGVLASFIITFLVTRENLKVVDLEGRAQISGLAGLEVRENSRYASERFFSALKQVARNSNQPPNVGALIEIELSPLSRAARMVELLGNILITLGLIGTVMGLTLTLTGLTGSLESLGEDHEKLLSGLRQAMGGMGTAFYTTLLGAILGGVLLRVFAQINHHAVESLSDSMTRICLVHCATDLQPTLEKDLSFLEAQIRSLGQNTERLRQAFLEARETLELFEKQLADVRRRAWNPDEKDALEALVETHRQYMRVLRQEAEAHAYLYGTPTERIRAFFRRIIAK